MSTTLIAAAPARADPATSEHPVVACYRGPDSAHAVQLGALLAEALDEPLVLACAYRYEPVGLSARAERPDNSRRAGAAQATLRAARTIAGTSVEVREYTVAFTGIVDALIALARDVDACALVLGRDTQGHVARSLVPRARCPVVVAPPTARVPPRRPLNRIGVAYDGSPAAQTALVAAQQLALATGARLVVIAAGHTTEHATALLHDAPLSLHREIDLETQALAGETPHALTQASRDLDLLVCGSRGRRRPLAAVLGSVSAHLIAHAQCPVLVVPPVVSHSDGDPPGIASAVSSEAGRVSSDRGRPLR